MSEDQVYEAAEREMRHMQAEIDRLHAWGADPSGELALLEHRIKSKDARIEGMGAEIAKLKAWKGLASEVHMDLVTLMDLGTDKHPDPDAELDRLVAVLYQLSTASLEAARAAFEDPA